MAFVLPLMCSCGCQSSSNPGTEPVIPQPEPQPETATASFYVTTADESKLFEEEDLQVRDKGSMPVNEVLIDTTIRYQSITGFGAALTGGSCYNILRMGTTARQSFLKEIFDKNEGLGVSLIRVSIGSSDFGLDEYTWCDKKGIENFAVNQYDKRDLFSVLRQIYAINPDVKIIGSPWSVPQWMKRRSVTNNSDFYSWTSGSLKPECYQDYATYFVKWIQTMQTQGFNIYAVTIQNEPLNHGNSMSTYMTWEEQRNFIKEALGPAFERAGLDTKILIFDHNYNYDNVASQQDYPLHILEDPDAAKYVAGTAWHNYGGSPATLDKINAEAPDKEIYFTEASIGSWNYNFAGCLLNDFNSIYMQTLTRMNKGVTLWNLMLDEKNGPYRPGGCSTCYGVVTLNSATGQISARNSHYYNIAHTSKVISPGAVRVATSGFSQTGISYLAFLNPDKSYGIIVLNTGTKETMFTFSDNSRSVKCTVPAKAIASIKWNN